MKKLSLVLWMGMILCISLLMVSCVGQGNLAVVDFDYPKEYNLINYGREVQMTIILNNAGTKSCVVEQATSSSFWNVDEPGLSGRYFEHINAVIPAGSDYVLKLHPYLRDGDILQTNTKVFEIFLSVSDGCVIDSDKLTGFLNIEIENSQIAEDVYDVVYSEDFSEKQ